MSARALVNGALHKAAEERTSKAGTRFSTFTLREKRQRLDAMVERSRLR